MNSTVLAPLLLNVNEAAKVLAISRTKLYELISRKELKTVHIDRSIRIPYAVLVQWVQDHEAYSDADEEPI